MISVCLRINSEGLWEEVAPTGMSGHRNVECVWYASDFIRKGA